MSKTKLLLDVVSDLRSLADSLSAIADEIGGGGGEADVSKPSAAETEPSPPKTEPSDVKLEQVRAVLAEKSRAGHTAEIRELLEKYGATRLSEIAPEEYPVLLAEAEVLGDG